MMTVYVDFGTLPNDLPKLGEYVFVLTRDSVTKLPKWVGARYEKIEFNSGDIQHHFKTESDMHYNTDYCSVVNPPEWFYPPLATEVLDA